MVFDHVMVKLALACAASFCYFHPEAQVYCPSGDINTAHNTQDNAKIYKKEEKDIKSCVK